MFTDPVDSSVSLSRRFAPATGPPDIRVRTKMELVLRRWGCGVFWGAIPARGPAMPAGQAGGCVEFERRRRPPSDRAHFSPSHDAGPRRSKARGCGWKRLASVFLLVVRYDKYHTLAVFFVSPEPHSDRMSMSCVSRLM
jgi:hypothetical protein